MAFFAAGGVEPGFFSGMDAKNPSCLKNPFAVLPAKHRAYGAAIPNFPFFMLRIAI
ncbi:hypothetical protein [Desulfovibrio sp. ZJ369]|uniref:hypothetical protein n=1 Tax=Desulfovibrio sp. ZJ369 TaxID=2709793 RepID=UPI0013EB02B9|nr:hypothetical protein [Desulfovibrio sp. ZJ369]